MNLQQTNPLNETKAAKKEVDDMALSVEKTAKTKQTAIDEALEVLNATIDEVNIEILEEGSRGFLGLGSKPCKIRATKIFNPVKTAKTFLREIFVSMGISVEVLAEYDEKTAYLNINLKGDDMGIIIGKRGQTLDSLQYLVNIIVNKGDVPYVGVNIDTEQYRQKRKETLEKLAIGLAKKSKHLKKDVVLEPMNPYERRIIHATLQNDKFVTTHSEGDGSYRYVVISPKKNFG